MQGDIGRIPIISLSGCIPITNILCELPIPQSTHVSIGCRTLLYEPKLVHDAYRCINGDDETLVRLLTASLRAANTDNIIFRESSPNRLEQPKTSPTLLKTLSSANAFTSVPSLADHFDSVRASLPHQPETHLPSRSVDIATTDYVVRKSGGHLSLSETGNRESYSATRIAPLRISLKKTPLQSDGAAKKRPRRLKRSQKTPHTAKVSSACIVPVPPPLETNTTASSQPETILPQCVPKLNCPVSSHSVLSPGANGDSIAKDVHVLATDSPQVCGSSSCTTLPSSPMLSITTSPLARVASESTPVSSHAVQVSQDSLFTRASVHSETTSVATTSFSALPVSTTDSLSVRRVPDPALSHLFQSAALFHPYQPHCEQGKANSTAGGGLFDDWVDSSSKTADLNACAIHLPLSVDGTCSGSVSGPSSVTGNASHAIQAPHSVGGAADMPIYMSQSPQSVPSNYSSYPATPGGGLPSISSVQTNPVSSVVASPSHLIKGVSSRPTLPSPSVRLFDNLESRTDTHEPNLEDQPRIAAHGLAAYLPRSSSMRQQAATEDDIRTRRSLEDPRSASPQVPSPNTELCGPYSAGASDSGSRPQSTCKGVHRSASNTLENADHYFNGVTPQKSGSRGRVSGGKPRGGGRRRRTELEELCNWNINDRSQPSVDFKIGSLPSLPDERQVSELAANSQSSPNALPGISSSADNSVVPSSENSSNRQSPNVHGIFTEALVERVKRRRQLESQKRQNHQLEPVITRSSEGSPESTLSPMCSTSKSAQDSERSRTGKQNTSFCIASADHRRRSGQRSHDDGGPADIYGTNNRFRRSKSSESDSSVSPGTTPLSSVRSFKHDGSISSYSGSVPPNASFHPRSHVQVETGDRPHDHCDTNNHPSHDSPSAATLAVLKSPSVNFGTESSGKRRRRILMSDEEELKLLPSEINSQVPLPPKLEEVQVHHLKPHRTTEGSKVSNSSASPTPPTLLPLNSPLLTNSWAKRDSLSSHQRGDNRKSHHLRSRSTNSDHDTSMGSLNGKRSSPSPIRKQGRGRPRKLPETQGTDHSCAASTGALSSVASGDQSHRRLVALPTVPVKSSNQCAAGADATVTNTSMPFTGPGITDSDDGTSSPSDEQSTYSISSLCSPPVPCERDLSYTSDQRCLTPSTLPYTHSSAMEDSAPEETMWTPPGAPNRIHDEPDNAQNDNPSSLDQSSDVDSSCSELCLASKLSPLSSISTAFSAGEDPDAGSADNDSDVEQIHNDDLVTAASVLAQFTARLGKILRRVEELDLLKLAYDINMRKTKVAAGGDEFENEIKCADLVPDAVRLSRHELNVLYTESAQVRLAGSMYTIPTGRLVRFLTLILVNMQAGAHASLLPLSPDEVVLYLEGRNRQRYEGGRRTLADQISESVLWSNPEWSAVLVGLDSARIALNIIAAPDMPRPLLMEDLVEGIVSIVRHVLDGVVCKLPALSNVDRPADRTSGLSSKALWNFTVECVGYRVSQILAVLSCLVRFQPGRFTDNLVIRLTGLSLAIPLHCLKTGQSVDRDPKRLSAQVFKRMLVVSSATATDSKSPNQNTNVPTAGASRLWLLVWPNHLQRASLALLSGLYSQYESHCKLIVDEIFSTLLNVSPLSSAETANKPLDSTHSPALNDRATARTFRLLSSKWFYMVSKNSKNPTSSTNGTGDSSVSDQKFLRVHALTALFLSLTQSLIQAPGSPPTSSTSGGGGGSSTGATRRLSVCSSSDHQVVGENSQFCKDEKQVLLSYSTCMRHAQYLFSGLLKRVCSRTELDLRPVLETVTCDLLAVATSAVIEWPVAPTLISVLSSLLVQHLGQNSSSNCSAGASRNSDLTSKLIYLDTLTTLAIGLKRNFPTSSFAFGRINKGGLPDHHVDGNSVAGETDSRIADAVAQTQLVGFLSSPMSVMHHWFLEPGVTPSNIDSLVSVTGTQLRQLHDEIMKWIRLEYADCLILTAQRFYLASWLSDCTRELGDVASNTSKPPPDSRSVTKNVRELEQIRHQLLSELAMTHHTAPNSIPWLTGSRQSGSAVVGSSSLSSPTYGGRPNSRSGTGGYRSGGCSTPNRTVAFGGSMLAPNASAQRFVYQAHTRHLNTQYRLRLSAHVHWSARKLQLTHPISPGFEKLFGIICRLVGEPSVPLRTKALRCLASTVELDPNLFAGPAAKLPSEVCDNVSRVPAWLRDLPRLVHARLLDNSTAVREAAVDLVSRLLIVRPRLLSEYYPMLAERVLDKGVSVRKRAIRCFRDLLTVNWSGEGSDSASRRARYKEGVLLTRQHGVEMCLKLIRRLHDDEESIQKLVIELFHNLWFTPIPSSNIICSKLLDRRITSLSGVISVLRSGSFDMLEAFLKQILTTSDPTKEELLESACVQLVDRLLLLVKRLSSSQQHSTKIPKHKKLPQSHTNTSLPPPTLQCLLASLHLISRCKPNLLRSHCKFFVDLLHRSPVMPSNNSAVSSGSQTAPTEPCVSSSGGASMDVQCLFHLISVIEMTLVSFTSGAKVDSSFTDLDLPDGITLNKLHDLERNLVRLIQRQGRVVVDSSLSCLAMLTNRVLKDHAQVAVCFGQFYGLLTNLSFSLRKALSTKVTSTSAVSSRNRPSVLRALYTVGLMCKHFEIEDLMTTTDRVASSNSNVLDEVVDTLMLFAEYAAAPLPADAASEDTGSGRTSQYVMNDPDLCRKAVMGLGFVLSRHDHLLCTKRVRTFLSRFFTMDHASLPSMSSMKISTFHEMQCIVLDNLTHYLMETERQMVADNRLWQSVHKTESLKEIADGRSGHGSAVAQDYLPIVLNYCALTPSSNVRTSALGFVSVVMRQGLVQPTQALPFLICMQTDPDSSNRSRASHLLVEAERKMPGFVAIHVGVGFRMSYYMHLLLRITALETSSNLTHIPLVRGFNASDASCSPCGPSSSSSHPMALNHGVYAMLRSNRQSRRSLISSILSLFHLNQKPPESHFESTLSSLLPPIVWRLPLGQIVFLADQLTHFPYTVMDEVLYVAFTVERLVSDCGPSLVRAMQQALLSSMLVDQERPNSVESETLLLNLLDAAEAKLCNSHEKLRCSSTVDGSTVVRCENDPITPEWDDRGQLSRLFARAAPSTVRQQAIEAMFHTGPVCFLLLAIRAHLREFYGVTDSKLKDYAPSDSVKQWDKPIQTVKKSAPGQQSLALPSFVLQCMKNPQWLDLTELPSDTFVLAHFIRLRYQLLALEGGQSEELNCADVSAVSGNNRGGDTALCSTVSTREEQPITTEKHRVVNATGRKIVDSPSKASSSADVSSTVPPVLQPEGAVPQEIRAKHPSSPSKVRSAEHAKGAKAHHGWSSSSRPNAAKKRKARSPSTSSLGSTSSSSSALVNKNIVSQAGRTRMPSSSVSSLQNRKEKARSILRERSTRDSNACEHRSEHQNERSLPRPISRHLSSSSDLDSEGSETRLSSGFADPKRRPASASHHSRKDVTRSSTVLDNAPHRAHSSTQNYRTKIQQKHHTVPTVCTRVIEQGSEPRKSKVIGQKSNLRPDCEGTKHGSQLTHHPVGTAGAVRSLAPLPEAMMHSSHASRSGQPKCSVNKAKSKLSLSSSYANKSVSLESAKVIDKMRGSPLGSSSARSTHTHTVSKTIQSKRPQRVRQLSGSSSSSEDSVRKRSSSLSSSSVSSVSTPSDCSTFSGSSSPAGASLAAKPKKSRKVVR